MERPYHNAKRKDQWIDECPIAASVDPKNYFCPDTASKERGIQWQTNAQTVDSLRAELKKPR